MAEPKETLTSQEKITAFDEFNMPVPRAAEEPPGTARASTAGSSA